MFDADLPNDTSQHIDALTATLRHMGAVVLSAETIDTTVSLVCTLAIETIPGTTGAGVSLIDAKGKRSRASSGSLVERADALQYESGSGPCLTAWRDQAPVRVDDISTDPRWPQWSAAVVELGLRSILSVPLVSQHTAIGAIKVYSTQVAAYDAGAERLLALFAAQAAILLLNSQALVDARRLGSQLSDALTDRDLIGQAKGVLIAQGAPSEEAAFSTLATTARTTHQPVVDAARNVIASASKRHLGSRELSP